MPALPGPISGFLFIPYELRHAIYEYLVESDDMTPLAQTCRQLRSEIWARMPGGSSIDYANPKSEDELARQIEACIEVQRLDIIAEPWFSSVSALKLCATWRLQHTREYQTTTWTIRDLSSPMARVACLCRPQSRRVVFQAAPAGSNQLVALLILRCKLFDICRLLVLVCQPPGSENAPRLRGQDAISILFRDRKHGTQLCRRPRSFWEMRTVLREPARSIRRAIRTGRISKWPRQRREECPFFYECLMLPLFSCRLWKPEKVEFDTLPTAKHSSFFHWDDEGAPIIYHGCHALFVVLRQLYVLGPWDFSDEFPDQDEDLEELLRRMVRFSSRASTFLSYNECPEASQLRSYLQRMRKSHRINPFAGDVDANPPCATPRCLQAGYEADYPGEHRYMRRELIDWAMEKAWTVPWASLRNTSEPAAQPGSSKSDAEPEPEFYLGSDFAPECLGEGQLPEWAGYL